MGQRLRFSTRQINDLSLSYLYDGNLRKLDEVNNFLLWYPSHRSLIVLSLQYILTQRIKDFYP